MPTASDSYHITAKYYDDVYANMSGLDDLGFYVDLARRIGGPVLELACGTGRVLLPIARQGIAIHGVDNSQSMLDQLHENLKHEPKDVRELVSAFPGDMRTFRSNRKYPLVIIPFRPMQHMYTVEDQLAALVTAAFHLEDDGLLAFDVFYPRYELIFSGIAQESLDIQWKPSTGAATVIRRYFRKDAVDKVNQHFSSVFIYRAYEGESLVSEETEPLKMCWYTYPQLRALFMLAGLEIVEEYGSFARRPLDNAAEQMVFVVRRAGSRGEI